MSGFDNTFDGQRTENFSAEDFANMDEVDAALEAAGLSPSGPSAEDEAAMAELEQDLDNEDDANNSSPSSPSNSNAKYGASSASRGNSRAVIPEGAMPSRNGVLSSAAAEFWFPECRNCPCCNGFKHGCKCRAPGVDTCTHPECVDPAHATAARAAAANNPAAATAPASSGPISHGTPRALPVSAAPLAPRGPPDAGSGPCKFHNSPGGCRFGAACRHAHIGPGGGSSGGSYSPSGGYAPRGFPAAGPGFGGPPGPGGGGAGLSNGQPCIYFQQGSCRFGAACRFVHV